MCAVTDCAPLPEGCEPYYTDGTCCPTCEFLVTIVTIQLTILALFKHKDIS